ncbi:disulfide bond formation protein DsbD [Fulvivirga sp. M361]|uniref:protein-disulfide reductase DsbD family protein n=1 Tax=Fulvivirga sp. M361 TaxID=2594266 RepID=UPI00117B7977|nr:cytochrome c biogenesis protein CcdA [Fulvivirga sp. M361]TRX58368.1 disulfide bond formation protein DsbD [Fulvivirga sp. M361]
MFRTARYLVLSITLLICITSSFSQILEPSKWTHEVSKTDVKIGEEVELIFTATIDKNWYLYSSDFDPDCGPMVTTFTFESNDTYELVGELRAINPVEKYDDVFECNVRTFKKTGQFKQTIKILKANPVIVGNYEFQVCSDIDGKCIPFDYDFEFSSFKVNIGSEKKKDEPKPAPKKAEEPTPTVKKKSEKAEVVAEEKDTSLQNNAYDTQNSADNGQADIKESAERTDYSNVVNEGPILDPDLIIEDPKDKSIILFMIFAFVGGLAALLTPCVFPMIPMTVTYFTGKVKGKSQAIIYGLSIILIYTVIGSALAPLMGPETANHLSTEWVPNLIFFTVFIVFALSFFGLFEITLPSGFVNQMDQKADRGGLIGVFFMAFTLVLVSFSCTGPIVGSILVASAGGEVLKPILGMFSFSLAFAVPFTLIAIFPGWLSSLPKSGGWLNSVKVVLGFIELALAFKFLSIADQAFHWGILDRDLNIAIWIVIFTLMGFYLLGKIKLPHDSPLQSVSVLRLMFAIATFTFVIYLIPGLWGAPLKALAGYLPPMYTHDFDLISTNRQEDKGYDICDTPKYADFLHLPHGLKGYFDYDQALACARAQGKPLFIDFTGHGCTNCREMEAVVWSHPDVLRRLKEDYVIVALYVDDKTDLPESDWYTSSYDSKVKKTIGKQNADLQIRRLNNNAQPFYILLGADEKVLVSPVAYDKEVDNFIRFLDKGLDKYRELYK